LLREKSQNNERTRTEVGRSFWANYKSDTRGGKEKIVVRQTLHSAHGWEKKRDSKAKKNVSGGGTLCPQAERTIEKKRRKCENHRGYPRALLSGGGAG